MVHAANVEHVVDKEYVKTPEEMARTMWAAVTLPLRTRCPEGVLFREGNVEDYGKEATHGASRKTISSYFYTQRLLLDVVENLEPSESMGVEVHGLTSERGLGRRRETVIIIRNNRPPTE